VRQTYLSFKISVEQTSSERTAYKATLVSGTSLIDLTGGFESMISIFKKK
jgi:hypothetical protein